MLRRVDGVGFFLIFLTVCCLLTVATPAHARDTKQSGAVAVGEPTVVGGALVAAAQASGTTGGDEFGGLDDFDDFDDFDDVDEDVNDPFESFNRKMFAFNQFFEDYLIRPLATAYSVGLPKPIRSIVRNMLDNLTSPMTFANDILQGEGKRAGETLARLTVNTTLGLGGMIDMADQFGMPDHSEDFGQTLAVWGVGDGPYIVIPLFGPSNPRDGISLLADSYMDPLNVWMIETGRTEYSVLRLVVDQTDDYSEIMDDLDSLKKTSIDYYAAIRSLYRQKRASDIRNGRPETSASSSAISQDYRVSQADIY